jgi:hypothetical protein
MPQTSAARSLLARAAFNVTRRNRIADFTAGCGAASAGVHFVEGDGGAGGSGDAAKAAAEKAAADKAAADKAAAEKAAADKLAAEKVTLTAKELDERIKAEVAKFQADAAAKAAEEKKQADAAAEAKKLAEEGKWKELNDKKDAENASLKIDLAIRDHLAGDDKLKDYAGCAKYIKPLIPAADAADPSKLATAIKTAVEQYVKDNPRQPTGGPAPSPGRGAKGEPRNEPSPASAKTAEERSAAFLNRFQPPPRLQPSKN